MTTKITRERIRVRKALRLIAEAQDTLRGEWDARESEGMHNDRGRAVPNMTLAKAIDTLSTIGTSLAEAVTR